MSRIEQRSEAVDYDEVHTAASVENGDGHETGARRSAVCAGLTVAFFTDVLPGRSGVGTYYDDLLEHLEDHVGCVVLVSPPRLSGPRLPWSIPLPGDSTQRLYFPSPRRLWREMKVLSPDVVVCATPGPYGVMGAWMAGRLGAGLCVGLHTRLDDLAGLYWRRLVGPIFRPILRGWDHMMFRRAGAVLVNNEQLLRRTRAEGVSGLRLVGTPAPRSFLETPLVAGRGPLSSVAFIGRLAPEKRLDEVFRAAERFPGINFRIVGDGPLRAEVDERAHRMANLDSLGWVGREEVLEVLDQTDLLVLPSRFETFGTIALEALSRGKPALVSPHCGITRWPELGAGLFKMKDGESLSDAIGRIEGLDHEVRREKARRGRLAARALNQQTIEDWLDVIEEVWRARRER